ncbi:MAG: translation initiation factor IF-1 [Anaerolineae bacterium]
MARKPVQSDKLETEGVVIEALPNASFRVALDGGVETLAYLAGRLRKNNIRVLLGDRVRVELTPYDLTRGRIVYRLSNRPSPQSDRPA